MALEFFRNVFTEMNSLNSIIKIFVTKRARTSHLLCKRPDQDATTAPVRHMWETRSLNWAQFMLQWFITESSESSAWFRKTALAWKKSRTRNKSSVELRRFIEPRTGLCWRRNHLLSLLLTLQHGLSFDSNFFNKLG